MKKLLLSLFCLMLISQIALTQSSLDSGLVAYYPFNGNANDSSVNHNNGTVYNATITTDRFGNPNSAYSFNGTNAYIVASANTLPSTVRSISLWFYANNVTSHPVLFAYGGNGNCAQGTSFMMALNVANSNKYSTISHCSIKDVNAPYTTPPINQWMHWVVVANGTSTKFYLNGLLYKDSAVVYNNTYTPSTNLAFGTGVGWNGIAPYSDANIGYLNGKLDDIRIYNRELSISEILSLYSNQWTLINNGLPSPQNVIAITSNSAYLFAGLDGGGVYRSTNNGDNWSVVNNGFSNLYVKSLLISGTNVFAGMIGGVYISTNNGTNWTLSGVSGDVVSLSSNGTNIFAGTTIGGVFRSTNNGGSWTAVNSGLTNLYVYALISNGTNLFAGTISSGVFFSSNNGANWTAVNTGLTNLNVRSFTSTGTNIFVATQGGGVFLSTNSGGSWTALNTGLTNLNEYSLTSVGTNVFVGNYNGGVFLSTNNGLNWTDKSQGIITTNTIQCLWLTNNYIFAGVYNG
ncbi:MAG: LamG domain-containing protein, partial [Ignavibacteriae bacterium]|nr:LamG domain-containing protein [Ignavibacteriota bacterium]